MSGNGDNDDRMLTLAAAVCDATASAEELAELEATLRTDAMSRKRYLKYCRMHVTLRAEVRAGASLRKMQKRSDLDSAALAPWEADALATAGPAAMPRIAPIAASIEGPTGYLTGWPLAYLVATVICGIGLSIGAFTYVSRQDGVISRHSPQLTAGHRSEPRQRAEVVGQITGEVDCEYEGTRFGVQGSGEANQNAEIHLGDRLTLGSGLLEITYNTGAKVILQGPVTYEVESPSGGYLSIGKLTARLEKSEVRGQRSEVGGQRSEVRGRKFVVRTPTALVTDLGTEFGVEVTNTAGTTTQVFRGSVRLEAMSVDGTRQGPAQVLHKNELGRIAGKGARSIVVTRDLKLAPGFVREIPKQQMITVLDLVDVVAGGDGFSGRRNAGIDPTTGRTSATPAKPVKSSREYMVGDGEYHRVRELPFVDGVFIPDGRRDPVVVDSAGHVFADFGATSNRTADFLWAGGKVPSNRPWEVPGTLGAIDYSRAGHGLLFMQSNKGITFDLEAVRRAHPGQNISKFRAVVGNTETASERGEPGGPFSADIWVLVDGQVRFKRRDISSYGGAMPISVSLNGNDRFLTLASTDGASNIWFDWIVFGDPRLELVPREVKAGNGGKGRR